MYLGHNWQALTWPVSSWRLYLPLSETYFFADGVILKPLHPDLQHDIHGAYIRAEASLYFLNAFPDR